MMKMNTDPDCSTAPLNFQTQPASLLISVVRGRFTLLLLSLMFVCGPDGLLFGQDATTAPAPVPVAPSGVIVRNLWPEIGITVLMVGAALFAVCRSSNRN